MSVKPVLLSIAMSSLLIGCGEKAAESFCKSHAKAHQLHQSDITQVNINYSEQGQIVAQVKIAQQHAQYQALTNVVKVLEVKADKTCSDASVEIIEQGIYYQASYSVDCGAENKLKKVSVPILDNFKTIDEVEVTIGTPSSAKHFLLSRQCDSPIFNL